jgi:hypothetical protein
MRVDQQCFAMPLLAPPLVTRLAQIVRGMRLNLMTAGAFDLWPTHWRGGALGWFACETGYSGKKYVFEPFILILRRPARPQ